MATYGPHALVTPEYPTAADGPSAFQLFAASVEKGLYGTALDEADRDTRYADIPPGGLVTSHERLAVWMRTETGWHTMSSERTLTTGFSASSGWSLDSFDAFVTDDRLVTLSLEVTRTGGTISAPASGDIGNTEVGYLPAGCRPGPGRIGAPFRATGTSGSALIGTSGQTVITDMNSNSSIQSDHYLTIDFTYRLGG